MNNDQRGRSSICASVIFVVKFTYPLRYICYLLYDFMEKSSSKIYQVFELNRNTI